MILKVAPVPWDVPGRTKVSGGWKLGSQEQRRSTKNQAPENPKSQTTNTKKSPMRELCPLAAHSISSCRGRRPHRTRSFHLVHPTRLRCCTGTDAFPTVTGGDPLALNAIWYGCPQGSKHFLSAKDSGESIKNCTPFGFCFAASKSFVAAVRIAISFSLSTSVCANGR